MSDQNKGLCSPTIYFPPELLDVSKSKVKNWWPLTCQLKIAQIDFKISSQAKHLRSFQDFHIQKLFLEERGCSTTTKVEIGGYFL